MKRRIGILGGSFDPVHIGHLILAEQIRDHAELDKVIMVPALVSPFKTEYPPAPGEDRSAMLKAAIGSYPGLEVSDMELNGGWPSYTYSSLLKFREMYPEDEIYYIIGSDSLAELDRWYKAEELFRDFPFICGIRPGFSEDAAQLDKLKAMGALIKLVQIPEVEVSSSDIRRRLSLGRSVKYLVPDAALDIINEKGLYRDLAELCRRYAENVEKPSRFKHTEGVVKMALELCRRYGGNPKKAEIAAWLHDTSRSAGNLEHGPAAAENIEKLFGIRDPEILNAVRYHTTGRPGMCLTEKILKIADSLEEGRDYPGVSEMRAAVTDDPDETLLMMMKHTREYVLGIGGKFDSLSDDAIAWLSDITNKRKQEAE